MNKWDYPQTINPIVAAFPANVTGTLLPPAEDIPTEFFDSDNKWAVFTSQLFGHGWDGRNPSLVMKDGVDASLAFEHFQTVLKSFEPKHENKIAGAAYLLSLWFTDVVPMDQIEEPTA